MKELKNLLERAMKEISDTTDLFYQQKDQEAFSKLNATLVITSSVMEQLFATLNTEVHPDFDQNELVSILTNAMNAMEEKDTVLLADILRYELLEQFEQIAAQL
ncbi:MAG: hypothetical protein E7256_17735 [Lachnospiraceae bacterium]|nr:hypothetical protein [Lachnospiraceae bacterium]